MLILNLKTRNYEKHRNIQDDLINQAQNTNGYSEDTGEVFENLPVKKYDKDSLIIK